MHIHRWTGLVSGVVMLVVCTTGSLYAFKTEITETLVSRMGVRVACMDSLFAFIINGHRYLWLPPEYGRVITGYGTLLFLIALISGIIIWWPRHWNRSAFLMKRPMTSNAFLYSLHVLSGVYLLTPLVLLCFTGMVYAMDWLEKLLDAIGCMNLVADIHRGHFWGIIGQLMMFGVSLSGALMAI